ncbi:hypothetical protein B0O99DRAFT_685290 [Bisporella sp. PMI_857]|nr:hypothetical protein B0O99DRAFT_685290 [Bisporella sp. PMI_857]
MPDFRPRLPSAKFEVAVRSCSAVVSLVLFIFLIILTAKYSWTIGTGYAAALYFLGLDASETTSLTFPHLPRLPVVLVTVLDIIGFVLISAGAAVEGLCTSYWSEARAYDEREERWAIKVMIVGCVAAGFRLVLVVMSFTQCCVARRKLKQAKMKGELSSADRRGDRAKLTAIPGKCAINLNV